MTEGPLITWPGRMAPVPDDLEEHESLKIGLILPNGATLVASKRDEKHNDCWIVLAVYCGYEPYVTWKVNSETLEAFWGHYHTSLGDALVDFAERT